jgi:hypothetical protein
LQIAPKALETLEVQYNEYKYAVIARKGIISISTCIRIYVYMPPPGYMGTEVSE